ncbi:MAG: molybdopterin dinucleotide-binding protein [Methanomicrobiales archaeon]|nr:molybdopterin dinucleotide-binding protein [Methanomicrobiales archaeon]NYT20237.1 molybdopterin dinucleotide-binding protein [Methanomicrobiales archaeon]
MRAALNTGRTIRQGSYVERKNSPAYREEASSLHMNRVDMLELEIEEGDHVCVRSDQGAVVMVACPAEGLDRGEVFVCLGPFANFLVDPETHGTGMPDFKTTAVTIEPTTAPVPAVKDLMEQCGGSGYEG